MQTKPILKELKERKTKGLKTFMLLIDPDKFDEKLFLALVEKDSFRDVHYFLVGGSLITGTYFSQTIRFIKKHSQVPVIIFPGSNLHIDYQADAILLLSLISGRNAEFLIGQHVVVAPILKKSNLEILPTGYMLIEGGKATTVSYISNTTPIPADKPEVAACTAMAGEQLGLQLIYADAGSGAKKSISPKMISTIQKSIDIPLMIGGGIKTAMKAAEILEAGADIIVIGNAIEDNPELLTEISGKVKEFNDKRID